MTKFLNWRLIKFLIVVGLVYTVLTLILTHLPQILALLGTMYFVHWVLSGPPPKATTEPEDDPAKS